jgi:hypothetical protein
MMKTGIMVAAQSLDSSSPSIERAVTVHNRIFVLYVVVLALAAALTYLVWRSGNAVRDAIRHDADVRIAEAGAAAASAYARMGEAELELQSLKKRQEPRSFSLAAARDEFKLEGVAKGTLAVMYQPDDYEAHLLATTLLLSLGGDWNLAAIFPRPIPPDAFSEHFRKAPSHLREIFELPPFARMGAKEPSGIALISRDGENDPTVRSVEAALNNLGLAAHIGETDSALKPHDLTLVVGPKP